MATDNPEKSSLIARVRVLIQDDSEFDRDHIGPWVVVLTVVSLGLTGILFYGFRHTQMIYEWLTTITQ